MAAPCGHKQEIESLCACMSGNVKTKPKTFSTLFLAKDAYFMHFSSIVA